MERHIKQIIGGWLCNLYDSDREVRAAAALAWRAAFSDDAKEVYSPPLLLC